jgi:hypothetical protein
MEPPPRLCPRRSLPCARGCPDYGMCALVLDDHPPRPLPDRSLAQARRAARPGREQALRDRAAARVAAARAELDRAVRAAVETGAATVFDLQEPSGLHWGELARIAGKLGTEPGEHVTGT